MSEKEPINVAPPPSQADVRGKFPPQVMTVLVTRKAIASADDTPVAAFSGDVLEKLNLTSPDAVRAPDGSNGVVAVAIYAWKDTTYREVLEVLRRGADVQYTPDAARFATASVWAQQTTNDKVEFGAITADAQGKPQYASIAELNLNGPVTKADHGCPIGKWRPGEIVTLAL